LKQKVLYVFGGEQASGAEIVIERLMSCNLEHVEPHLFISPGRFADNLLAARKPYAITLVDELKKLNRSSAGKLGYYAKAIANYFSISRKVWSYAQEHKINIIHANTVVPASYLVPAIIFAKITGSKKKWFWSDHDIKHFARLDHYFSEICVRLYDKTLVVSNAVKAKYGTRPTVEVLYNGLDPEVFKPDTVLRVNFRQEQKLPETVLVFGIAATISPRKGQVELVRVFKELLKEQTNIYLVIAGGMGADSPEYNKQFLQEINGVLNVILLGHYQQMVRFYNGCDVIINNSSVEGSEPLGTTIYEAMACSKIVVAAKTGGTAEIINHGIDGLVYEAGSHLQLKGCLQSVIDGRLDVEYLATNARKKALGKFSISRMCTQYNKVLNK
jgi:glycosyltransferase involved in cell wall biosynthesis